MELSELNDLWQKQESRLDNHLWLNNQIVLQMKMDRTNGEFRRLMSMELIASIGCFLIIVFLAYFTVKYSSQLRYAVSGFVSIICFSVYSVFSLIRLIGFNKLSCYNESVVKMQKGIASLKKQMSWFRVIEFMIVPILLIALDVIGNKVINNIDVNLYSMRSILTEIIASIIAIFAGIWSYRIFYDKRIASAEALLKSIAEFEDEKC